LEAKFRAYFPERVQTLWRAYSAIVDYTLARLYGYREGLVAVEDVRKYSQYLQRQGIDTSITTIDGLQETRSVASRILQSPELKKATAKVKAVSKCNKTILSGSISVQPTAKRRAIQCLQLQMQKQALLVTVRTNTENLRRLAVKAAARYRSLLTQLIAIQEEITAQVLRSHIQGYSTNWRDFLKGLGV